ncbi:hypothetical protein EYF80_016831 [Liparis tanakae]|uniref:Uncharacterized protein n=1 Tax=Liparis tanakae TaxID=230148 RepID=A0A4Z2I6J0_9TELE|nr:hypothetical protein EYF80_016831 [Liparis tanakae]
MLRYRRIAQLSSKGTSVSILQLGLHQPTSLTKTQRLEERSAVKDSHYNSGRLPDDHLLL